MTTSFGITWRAVVLLLAAAGLSPELFAKRAAKYYHASVGNLEVLTSAPDLATGLLYEVLEIRHQLQQIIGAQLVPDPVGTIAVFATQEELEGFMPEYPAVLGKQTGSFAHDMAGFSMMLVKSSDFEASRQILLLGYASYLQSIFAPRAPTWVGVGLSSYLSSTEYVGGKIRLGSGTRGHAARIRAKKLLPLATLMDDSQMRSQVDLLHQATPLHYESWALWHGWLSDPAMRHGQRIRTLFDAIANGAAGGAADVAAAFGSSVAELDAAHRAAVSARKFPWREVEPAGQAVLSRLAFTEAGDLERRVIHGTLFARSRQGVGRHALDLLQAAETYPDSPRPYEALGLLAMLSSNGNPQPYFEAARERGSRHYFTYLWTALRKLESQGVAYSLGAELAEVRAGAIRELLDRTLEFNSGAVDALALLATVEALAPAPRAEVVTRLTRLGFNYFSPETMVYVAIAQWRMGEREVSRKILAQCERMSVGKERSLQVIRHVVGRMDAATASNAR